MNIHTQTIISFLQKYVHVLLPYGVMGAFSLLAGILCWALPETKSVPTAEVMDQSDASGKPKLVVREEESTKF